MRPAEQAPLSFAVEGRRYDAVLHWGRRPGVLVTTFDQETAEPGFRFRLTYDLVLHDVAPFKSNGPVVADGQLVTNLSDVSAGAWQMAIVHALINRRLSLFQPGQDHHEVGGEAPQWVGNLNRAEFASLMTELEESQRWPGLASGLHAAVVLDQWARQRL